MTPTVSIRLTDSTPLDDLRKQQARLDDEADALEQAAERLAEKARLKRAQADHTADLILRQIFAGAQQ